MKMGQPKVRLPTWPMSVESDERLLGQILDDGIEGIQVVGVEVVAS